jgi:hypothetical protein
MTGAMMDMVPSSSLIPVAITIETPVPIAWRRRRAAPEAVGKIVLLLVPLPVPVEMG